MEFSTAKDSFIKGLQVVQAIADKRNTMPILSNVLMSCDDESLTLSATDLELSVINRVEVNVKEPGKITVPARKLYEIARELPDDEIFFSWQEGGDLNIRCRNIAFQLKTLSPEDFPSLPSHDEAAFYEVESAILIEMIDKIAYASSTEDIQYTLSGILVEKMDERGEMIRLVATDGHRLSMIERALNLPFIQKEGIIIPRKGLFEIKRILQGDEKSTKLSLCQNQVVLLSGRITLFIRLVEGVFPNYKTVIPVDNPISISLKKTSLLESLRRASIVSLDKFRGVKLELSNNMLKISSNNPDVGESEEIIDVQYSDKTMYISFNSRYMIEVLNALDSEEISLQLKNESSPVIIRDLSDEHFLAVVMPMRL